MTIAKDASLSYDLLLRIFEICKDYGTLYQCSLVNWDCNRAASRVLYARVVLSPPFRHSLSLRDPDGLSNLWQNPSQFKSSSLPRNADLVLTLEISGFLSPRPSPLNPLSVTLLTAIQEFKNLHTMILSPKAFHEDLFTDILKALKTHPSLAGLHVNPSCMDGVRAPILAEISGLRKLTLCGPTRAILHILPDWLDRLSNSLTELHLKDNCGSITPGVLRSFIPHLSGIHAFSLGLSYSLTDEEVFSFLWQFPRLETIRLRYYLQLKSPSRVPAFVGLRSFTVTHSRIQIRREVNRLCRWIRRVISSSPIERLQIICDDDEDYPSSGANVSFDSLIDHLVKKHSATLRFLDLGSAYVGVDAFKYLCQNCVNLEELAITAGRTALTTFTEHGSKMKYLHTASFEIRNVKRNARLVDTEVASEIFQYGPPSLRRLTVNGGKWEGLWISEKESRVRFVVRELPMDKGTRQGSS